MGLLLATITLCVCHVLGELDIWSPAWMIILVGSWTSIAASETDVNSPLNQTLMDKIRENLDHVERQGAKCGVFAATGVQNTTADRIHASRFRNVYENRINKIAVPIGNVAGATQMKFAVYDDSSNVPNNLLAYTTNWVSVATTDAHSYIEGTLNTTITLSAGTNYWFALVTDAVRPVYALVNIGGRHGGVLGSDEQFDDPFVDTGVSSTYSGILW
jgi:hypothetical protein